ncbi:MAG: adenylate class-3/4/guanylyl cyclase, partial [Limibacillus sp.]
GEAAYILEQKATPYHYNYGQMAACYGQLGRKEEAAECWARYLQGTPGATIASVGESNSYKHQADVEHWTEGLLKAGLSN